MDRILEQEAMNSIEEIEDYDKLVLQYSSLPHNAFVESIINFSPISGKFLDVGAGTGRVSIGIAKYNPNAQIVAIDMADNMVASAENNAKEEGVVDRIRFETADAKKLPFADGEFDTVFCHNTLHHIKEPAGVIEEMRRVVKNDGAILIRDLVRPKNFLIPWYVHILGFSYTPLMKEKYKESLMAALSIKEWKELYKEANIVSSKLTTQFITHASIERTSLSARKDYIEVPCPSHLKFFKKLYL